MEFGASDNQAFLMKTGIALRCRVLLREDLTNVSVTILCRSLRKTVGVPRHATCRRRPLAQKLVDNGAACSLSDKEHVDTFQIVQGQTVYGIVKERKHSFLQSFKIARLFNSDTGQDKIKFS